MIRVSTFAHRAGWIAPLLALAAPAAAQEVLPPPTPNADRLAEEMRVLAHDPRNVRALLSAGELSARLSDASAAAGFFARAQALDPGNPRVRAGQAMVMVRSERPGEALRLFGEAARGGLDMDGYASDRGLAYDLIGAQGHAQRDHRVAMRLNPDDETRRRFALSLGISGDADEAMTVLEPLLKRSDRAAWRARAFILAMRGDVAGADKIAASMMGGFGTALSPFFRRLPALAPADKAFAVHFGEIRRTPARIADASLAPPLPVLRGESGVSLAAAQAPVPQSAAIGPRGSVVPARRPSAAERRREARAAEEERVTQAREVQRMAQSQAQQREAQRLADLAAQQEREAASARQREVERLAAERAGRDAEARRVAELQARERAAAIEAERAREAQRLAQAPTPTPTPTVRDATSVAPAQPAPAQVASVPAARPAAMPVAPPTQSAVDQPAERAATEAITQPPVRDAAAEPGAPVRSAAASIPPTVGREDNVIARIVAGITIPASELGVDPMPGGRPAADPAPAAVQPQAEIAAPVQVARATPVVSKPIERTRIEPAAAPGSVKESDARARSAEAKAADDKAKAAVAKTKAADAKAADAKTKAAEAKAAATKVKAKPDLAKTEPARSWVQVAGGANVSDLPKTWRGLVAKAPVEFRGRQAWTTPLRFTNRLLVGPFKSSAEAQGFVNSIGRKGLSAFAWTSDAGQKIDRLAVR